MPQSPKKSAPKWHHPKEVMKLHQLKLKKRALQARIAGKASNNTIKTNDDKTSTLENIILAKKRKNPFIINKDNKRNKSDTSQVVEESSDNTIFKILNQNTSNNSNLSNNSLTSFNGILNQVVNDNNRVEIIKERGQSWLPIDWTLKSKIRLWSTTLFPWNKKLKISEEASGITGFARCLDANNSTTLDTAPNAKFHQCCLYWQQPSLPWLSLFPRVSGKVADTNKTFVTSADIRSSLQAAWADSLRSLFQLIRTKQCPYFYAAANGFTALFRAAGICGYSEVHAIITPTTRGFRHLLRQENVEFTMPLKKKRMSGEGSETSVMDVTEEAEENGSNDDEDVPDENWLKSMGINAEDIKQINYTQAKIVHKSECQVDNSDQSLVFVEGMEVHALYNFLINCKSATTVTGPLAGIPPTLLAPVAFNGATLNALKVRENKVQIAGTNYFSLELAGPILPSTIHNLFSINSPDRSMSATFVDVSSTSAFSKIKREQIQNSNHDFNNASVVFDKENLSDCGLNSKIIKDFCMPDSDRVTRVECVKYNGDNKTFCWT